MKKIIITCLWTISLLGYASANDSSFISFTSIDKNGDGFLSFTEYAAPFQYTEYIDYIFRIADLNNDCFISYSEWQVAAESKDKNVNPSNFAPVPPHPFMNNR